MKTDNLVSRHLIDGIIWQQSETIAVDPIESWEQMATEIISIVGEGGFASLYARSLLLSKNDFPWLESEIKTSQTPAYFHALKEIYAIQQPEQVKAANLLLLTTFTGILQSLIGEQLTLSILRTAWKLHSPDQTNKELINE
jgi:hypothetical protein